MKTAHGACREAVGAGTTAMLPACTPRRGGSAHSTLVVPTVQQLGHCRARCPGRPRVLAGCSVAAPERPSTDHATHLHTCAELGWRNDFSEQYHLLDVIGRGSFGVVWTAVSHHDPSHMVAVKVVPKNRPGATREDVLTAIRREVALWGTVSGDSRFVAELLGLYEDEQAAYLVQQLCRGGDLAAALKDGPLPEPCCAAIMWCVLGAIRDCHAHRVAMVDVKPQNFLLTTSCDTAASSSSSSGSDSGSSAAASSADSEPCIADGAHALASLRLEDLVAGAGGARGGGPCVVACDFGCSLTYTELARGGKHGGSLVFTAPEQWQSSAGLGVDIWAAGIMLYLLLSGRYPYWDVKRDELDPHLPQLQVMLAVCSAPITFSGPEWQGVSRHARDLVSLMLDRNPNTRISAEDALSHPWFKRWMAVGSSSSSKSAPAAKAAAKASKPHAAMPAEAAPAKTPAPAARSRQPSPPPHAGHARPVTPGHSHAPSGDWRNVLLQEELQYSVQPPQLVAVGEPAAAQQQHEQQHEQQQQQQVAPEPAALAAAAASVAVGSGGTAEACGAAAGAALPASNIVPVGGLAAVPIAAAAPARCSNPKCEAITAAATSAAAAAYARRSVMVSMGPAGDAMGLVSASDDDGESGWTATAHCYH